jgi:hypothetical protein
MERENVREVPREKAFYFFTAVGNYTGKSALSLKEFAEKLNEVDAGSLEFHAKRGDFERWLSEVVKDQKLAIQLGQVTELDLKGDELRRQLYSVVSKSLNAYTLLPSTPKTRSPTRQ